MIPVNLLHHALDTALQFSCLATFSKRALAFSLMFMATFTYPTENSSLYHLHMHILVGKKMCSLLFPFLNLIVVTL